MVLRYKPRILFMKSVFGVIQYIKFIPIDLFRVLWRLDGFWIQISPPRTSPFHFKHCQVFPPLLSCKLLKMFLGCVAIEKKKRRTPLELAMGCHRSYLLPHQKIFILTVGRQPSSFCIFCHFKAPSAARWVETFFFFFFFSLFCDVFSYINKYHNSGQYRWLDQLRQHRKHHLDIEGQQGPRCGWSYSKDAKKFSEKGNPFPY